VVLQRIGVLGLVAGAQDEEPQDERNPKCP
jgi:hypothetical protein